MSSLRFQFLLLVGMVFIFAASSLQGRQVTTLSQPMRVDRIAVGQQYLYVVDDFIVHRYRLEDYRYLGKFGKKGKGPGEFSPNFLDQMSIQLDGDKVVLSTWNKMAWFSSSGTLLREKVVPFLAAQIVPVGKHFVLTKYIPGKNGINQLAVQICDADFRTLKTLYAREDIAVQRSGKLDCPNEQIFIVKTDTNIFTYDQRPGTHAYEYDLHGNRQKSIVFDLKPMKMPQRFKDEVMGWMESNMSRIRSFSQMAHLTIDQMRQMVFYHEKLPVARNFMVQNGNIFIETYEKKDKKSRFVFISRSGKISKELYLLDVEPGRVKMTPHATYCVANNKYYYLKENLDDETWELYVEKLTN